jgi:hypothetical protein
MAYVTFLPFFIELYFPGEPMTDEEQVIYHCFKFLGLLLQPTKDSAAQVVPAFAKTSSESPPASISTKGVYSFNRTGTAKTRVVDNYALSRFTRKDLGLNDDDLVNMGLTDYDAINIYFYQVPVMVALLQGCAGVAISTSQEVSN